MQLVKLERSHLTCPQFEITMNPHSSLDTLRVEAANVRGRPEKVYIMKSPVILGHLTMRQNAGLGIFLCDGVNWTSADPVSSFETAD